MSVKKTKQKIALMMAMVLLFMTVIQNGSLLNAKASNVNLLLGKSEGWLESAYVEWEPVAGVDGYTAYVKRAEDNDASYLRLDNELIRQYSSYYRVDALGLKKGNYTIKVVPVIDGQEDFGKARETESLSVNEHTREGFAFSTNSPMKTGSGGYQDDGSIAEDAQVVYITAKTVNTVTLDVITSSKGKVETATGLVDILAKRQKGYDKRPLIIRMVGTITAKDISGLNSAGYVQLKGCYNVTLEGIGEDATVNGWGILVRDAHNVEIRNLGIMLFPDDGISLDTNNENIWVHHNDIFYGTAGSDADQAKGDGSMDVKAYSSYVTLSYNHFWDSGKCSLCGMGDSKEFYVTYHHNWFDHSDSRHPRIRVGTIHIYNNYFDGNSKYGVGVTMGSSAFVEANVFRNCKYPMLTSMQGSDIYGGNTGTFSKEAGGMIKAYNNAIEGATRIVYANEDTTQFDAYLATSRDEKVADTFKTISGSNVYNNFDTDASVMYEYTAQQPENVVEEVTGYSGRMNGGDFSFAFNNEVDDTSYAVNAALMAALKNYKSDLVSVGGMGQVIPSEPEVTPTATPTVVPTATPTIVPTSTPSATATPSEPVVTGTITHDFTSQGIESFVFTFPNKANLSTSYGSVNYNGMSFTQCLKMETGTEIAFTAVADGQLTMVFTTAKGKVNVKVNGEKVTGDSATGILTVPVVAGTNYLVEKADAAYVFYMELTGAEEEEPEATATPIPPVVEVKGNLYVAPNGTETGAGTYKDPMNLVTALQKVAPGYTIWMLPGVYSQSETIIIAENNSGAKEAYKTVKNYKDGKVIIDFSTQKLDAANRGLVQDGDYWHWYGIDFKGAGDNGILLSGSNNILELCQFYENRDTGLQISRFDTSKNSIEQWPSYNLIKNCTSYNNSDASGENADGFAAKLTCGEGNVFDGCMSYNNSDDGWDLYAKTATGPIGVVTLRNCIAFRNGKLTSGDGSASGDMNGFKLGGSGVPTAHIVENCMAFENGAHGFTDNNNPSSITFKNITSFNNSYYSGNKKANLQIDRASNPIVINALSISTTKIASDKILGATGASIVYSNSGKYYEYLGSMESQFDSSKKQGTVITPNAEDIFVSVEAPVPTTDFHTVWRNEDGSINTHGFLEVKETSKYASFGINGSAMGATFTGVKEDDEEYEWVLISMSGVEKRE